MSQRRYELTDYEWSVIERLLPNKPRGVPRVVDRRVPNGIYRRLRIGSPWADIPERYGPHTTCYNRFVRRGRLGVRTRIFDAVSEAYDRLEQSLDATRVRVHPHGANAKSGGRRRPGAPPWMTFEPLHRGVRAAGSPPGCTARDRRARAARHPASDPGAGP